MLRQTDGEERTAKVERGKVTRGSVMLLVLLQCQKVLVSTNRYFQY